MSSKNNEGFGLSPEDLESLRKIQEQEDKLYNPQAELQLDDEFDSETESMLDNSEDPKLNKQLFYKLQSIINKNVRKGAIRDFINNEKKLYLKSISNSGDSRFSFKNTFNELIAIADRWQRGDKNGFDLGATFYELNENSSFHHPKNVDEANKN